MKPLLQGREEGYWSKGSKDEVQIVVIFSIKKLGNCLGGEVSV